VTPGRSSPTLPRTSAAGALDAPAAARSAPPAGADPAAWQVWTGLSIIYVVWGSTYLAIRVMVETMPPLLGAGVRFLLAGLLVLAFLLARRGWRFVRPTRTQLLGALAIGVLLPGANGVVTLAEVDVPSALAALLIASVPLFLILLRRLAGEPVAAASMAGTVVGFAGVAILLAPGERPEGATLIAMLAVVGAAVMWASGSFTASRIDLPRHPLVSTGWQMLLGGIVISLAGLLRGEVAETHPGEFSGDSLIAFAYLVVIGSIVAFTAYAWLLKNVPVSKVGTYAYVNPAIAILLGWLVLDETITVLTLAGAALIVLSVAVVVRSESRLR
jgi:drug/metabolite transporter (DMT)-like permease